MFILNVFNQLINQSINQQLTSSAVLIRTQLRLHLHYQQLTPESYFESIYQLLSIDESTCVVSMTCAVLSNETWECIIRRALTSESNELVNANNDKYITLSCILHMKRSVWHYKK